MGARVSTFVVLSLFSLAARAQPPQCGDTKPLLTYEQWQAVLSEKADGDPVLEEAIAVEKAKYRGSASAAGDPVKVEWAQARKLVLLGAIHRIFQALNLSVTLTSVSGTTYTTKEPKLNEIWRVVAVVDPCSVYILRVME